MLIADGPIIGKWPEDEYIILFLMSLFNYRISLALNNNKEICSVKLVGAIILFLKDYIFINRLHIRNIISSSN